MHNYPQESTKSLFSLLSPLSRPTLRLQQVHRLQETSFYVLKRRMGHIVKIADEKLQISAKPTLTYFGRGQETC